MVYIERKPPLTAAGAFLRHERQINRLGTRPLGPVSIGPDEGSLTVTDASGNVLISMAAEAVRIPYRGTLTDLTPLLESAATKADVDQSMAAVNQAIAAESAERKAADTNIQTSTRNYADGVLATSKTYAESQVAAEAATRASQDIATLDGAQVYADTKHTQALAYADGTLTTAKSFATTQVNAEAATRAANDQAMTQNAYKYADNKVASEAAAREAWDTTNLSNAKKYADTVVSSEATARINGDSSTLASAKSDATSKASTAEANAKAAAQGYANTAESNAKSAAQGYASTAESNAKTYTNTAFTQVKQQADTLGSQLHDLTLRVNRLENPPVTP